MPTGPAGMSAPVRVRNKLGKGKLEKGRWEKLYIWAWDFAEECDPDDCELFDLCEYRKGHHALKAGESPKALKSSKCLMQQRYLRTVLHAVVETMQRKKVVSTEQMIRMGYQMIPLYAQLFKFKKMEFTNHELTYTVKGAVKINPLYKEIREIIKTIEGIWNKIASGLKDKKPAGEIGDDGYMDAMSKAMGEDVIDLNEPEPEEEADPDEGIGLDLEDLPMMPDIGSMTKPKPKVKKRRRRRRKK